MLALTQDAADVIRGIASSTEEPADGTGIRITADSTDSSGPQLGIAVVPGPQDGDQTVEDEGARVYLDTAAAMLLDDKVLDAQAHDDHVHFTVEDRPE